MKINFQTIEIILTIQKCNSISKAAKELYISEPALSKQIKRYEESLGYPLIIRNSNGCTLSEEGKLLAERGIEIIKLRDKMLNDMDLLNSQSAQVKKHLKFGIANCYSETLLSSFMPSFIKKYPNINVELLINKTDILEKMCIDGDVDIILTQKDYCDPRLESTSLIKEETVIYLPYDYCKDNNLKPFIESGSIPLKVLETYPFALGQGHSRFHTYIKQFFDEVDFYPNTVFQSESWLTILSLIENKMCYSIMPDIFNNNDKIIKLHIESNRPTIRTLALAYQPHNKLPDEWLAFIHHVKASLNK
ncbi:MAG: LysR family transcriptional regulator [Traorella sp.]